MAVIEDAATAATMKVESATGAARSIILPRGDGYVYSGTSGILAAALGAGSASFIMRAGAGATKLAYIDKIRIQYTTIVAFTTPVTAARRLSIFRGAGASATSGGTGVDSGGVLKKNTTVSANSMFDGSNSGDIRIATTEALTVTGATYDTEPLGTMSLVHVGAAGGFVETLFEYSPSDGHEIILSAGQLLAIRNPAAMDAAGTWQIAVTIDWREASAI